MAQETKNLAFLRVANTPKERKRWLIEMNKKAMRNWDNFDRLPRLMRKPHNDSPITLLHLMGVLA